jgi:hypothetical protein
MTKFHEVVDKSVLLAHFCLELCAQQPKDIKWPLIYMILRHHRNTDNKKGPDFARLPIRRPVAGAHFWQHSGIFVQ